MPRTEKTSLNKMIKLGRMQSLQRGHAVDRFTHVSTRRAEAFCRNCGDQVYVYANPSGGLYGQAVVRECSSVTQQTRELYARLFTA